MARAERRAQAKKEIGVVTSTRRMKTITVRVERRVKHPKYGKYVRRRMTLQAHDEHGTARDGDRVEIAFTRPLSRTKRWRLVRVVRSASASAAAVPEEPAGDGLEEG
ncbi:MAG: 30S ribosomal protein S17 [Planctomycetes bacterium]|nr:30S ribosomal protein S17 [Planctomycetota bacterium]